MTVTMTIPACVAEWFWQLEAQPLADVVPDPAGAAVFAADMVVGFCDRGPLTSTRPAALVGPVVDLFRQAYAHGSRHFVLVQDAHHPSTPEFLAFPPRCVRGTEEAHTIAALHALPFADHFTVIAWDRSKQAVKRIRELMREDRELSAVARAYILSSGDPRVTRILQSA